jgi:hypothetical protein
VTALLGDDFVRVSASKEFPDKIGNFLAIDFVFNFVKENHRELIDVHLFKDFYHGPIARCPDGRREKLWVDG